MAMALWYLYLLKLLLEHLFWVVEWRQIFLCCRVAVRKRLCLGKVLRLWLKFFSSMLMRGMVIQGLTRFFTFCAKRDAKIIKALRLWRTKKCEKGI